MNIENVVFESYAFEHYRKIKKSKLLNMYNDNSIEQVQFWMDNWNFQNKNKYRSY